MGQTMKLLSIFEGLDAARDLIRSKKSMLSRFESIHCGPCCGCENDRNLFNIVHVKVGPTLQVYFDKSLRPLTIEFRSMDGSILVSLHFREKEQKYVLIKASTAGDYKTRLIERTWE